MVKVSSMSGRGVPEARTRSSSVIDDEPDQAAVWIRATPTMMS